MAPAPKPALHIVFSPSAAGIVAQALRLAGFDDRVVCVAEALSFGPIDDLAGATRRAWLGEHLDWTFQELFDDAPRAWAATTSSSLHPVAWLTRRDANEYANYLEFVARMADAPFDLVEVPRVRIHRADGCSILLRDLGLLAPDDIVTARLWDYRRPAAHNIIADDRALWHRLKQENAPLRVIRDGALISAPITAFDDVILASIPPGWQRGTRIVGEMLATMFERETWVGDAFLWGRVRALAHAGILEIDGDPRDMCAAKVRARASSPA